MIAPDASENAPSALLEGGYYSIPDGDGGFKVAKVLRLEPDIVHVRIYKQHFSERLHPLDLNQLSLGSIDDEDGFGMGHLPLRLSTFQGFEPTLLVFSEVKPEELEGYQLWKDAQGGVFE